MPLAPVTEEMVLLPSRVLLPFEGIESWAKDRRYLVAPAVLKMCPLLISNLFSPPRDYHSSPPSPPSQEDNSQDGVDHSPFRSIVLGKAMVAVLGTQKYTDETYGWSSGCFVLRQNFLLEYEPGDDLNSQPRSYAHLQYSSVQIHENFAGLLELQFYNSPCRRENPRNVSHFYSHHTIQIHIHIHISLLSFIPLVQIRTRIRTCLIPFLFFLPFILFFFVIAFDSSPDKGGEGSLGLLSAPSFQIDH